ncbi:MAG: YjbQ family protein [Chloroflexi bacterium]|uniref:Secondary thiamine-phosphate synthase enzyme YjbQ n=1 Tax=Candidatus Chlorohelix allophototropha TaxID=3003348 RepID=A0A8T7MA92_9CHLR|nr:YjbQ family protein [Chloroflexota bacterium]WJW68890.1 secondary thiamine-phosphate synthase enzyme YjbQ [Chloroflexota bacterium L227-S17]
MNKLQPDKNPATFPTWSRTGFRVLTKNIRIQTHGDGDILDITKQAQERISETGLQNGTVTLFIQGSTAALTTMEFEPGLIQDLTALFEKLAPREAYYKHQDRWQDGNGFSHIRAAMLGPSLTVPFSDGFLTLGTWQQIIIVDFDNRPRQREIVLQIMGE